MTNIERAQEIYFALEARGFDMDQSGFMECIAATLDKTDLPESALSAHAPALLAACEAIQEAFAKGDIKFTRKRQADSDPHHPANVLLTAALASVKGE